MTIWYALLLGVVQGITEFLPISSSGHLVLVERLLHLSVADDHVFDVVLHAGSLAALTVYFFKDWVRMAHDIVRGGAGRTEFMYLVVGTIPAVVVGLLLATWIDSVMRTFLWTGIGFIVSGILLIIGERFKRPIRPLGFASAWWIGCMQAFAIIPAVSRSGATIAGGMLLGLSRTDATRFSFLLGMPALLGATILTVWRLTHEALRVTMVAPYLAGLIASAIVSFLGISLLIHLVKKHDLRVWAWYLFILGGIIIGTQVF